MRSAYISNPNSMKGNEQYALEAYIQQIRKIPLLTREEEISLARRSAQGDESAKSRLVRANLRFVVNIAKRYSNAGVPLIDLISEGNIGLMQALERYDVNRGYHFISYAVWWIKQAIKSVINDHAGVIRLPANCTRDLQNIQQARQHMQEQDKACLLPNSEKIADYLNMKRSRVDNLLSISNWQISLNAPVDSSNSDAEVGDSVPGDYGETSDDELVEQSLRRDLAKALEILTEQEANVLRARFGLDGWFPQSLRQLGEYYNLTKERIRQIEQKAIRRIQRSKYGRLLRDHRI